MCEVLNILISRTKYLSGFKRTGENRRCDMIQHIQIEREQRLKKMRGERV